MAASDYVLIKPALVGVKSDGKAYLLDDDDGDVIAPGIQFDQTGNVSGLLGPNGGVYALSESVGVVTLTATGTAFTGACEFRGFVVRAISGTPQTITVYDNTSATGTPIMTVSVSQQGTYYWDGNHATPGVGTGGRRRNNIGCHVVISGGTSRTIDVMVE